MSKKGREEFESRNGWTIDGKIGYIQAGYQFPKIC